VSHAALKAALALAVLSGCAAPARGPACAERCVACHATHVGDDRACWTCHRGDPEATRRELAHRGLVRGPAAELGRPDSPVLRAGEHLVATLACRRCHVVAGSGNELAVALDRVAWRRDPSALATSIREPVVNMPDFRLDESQVQAALAFVLSSADPRTSVGTYRVHFTSRPERRPSAFDEHCGGCHRGLLAAGPAGHGAAGPNLSGLFTPHYPATAPGSGRWTWSALARWLERPLAGRPTTTMPPRRLADEPLARLQAELREP